MTKTLLLLLLSTRLVLASPQEDLKQSDLPGHFFSNTQKERLWRQACEYYRAHHDTLGLFEADARRLGWRLSEWETDCPELMASLRARSTGLPPGPVRARFYWVSHYYSERMRDERSSEKFRELALAEPGLPALQKAIWLADDWRPETLLANIKTMRILYDKHPSPAILYLILRKQAFSKAGTDLEQSLALSRLQLAEKQGWIVEQYTTLMALWNQTGQEGYRERAARLVLAQPSSPWRDNALLDLTRFAKTEQEVQRFLPLVSKESVLDKEVAEVAWQFRSGKPVATALAAQARLSERYHQQRLFEKEIETRYDLASRLVGDGQLGASLRQLQTALQVRIDHPVAEPLWPHNSRGSLIYKVAEGFERQHHSFQALDLLEEALESPWLARADERDQILYRCLNLTRELGDQQRTEKYWLARLELVEQLPSQCQVSNLLDLYQQMPAGQEQKGPQILARARDRIQADLAVDAPDPNHTAQNQQLRLLYLQKDWPAVVAFWQKCLEVALREGNRVDVSNARAQLMYLYGPKGNDQPIRDRENFKKMLAALIHDPDTQISPRMNALEWSAYLAQEQDPEALVYSDLLFKLSSQNGSSTLERAWMHRARVFRALKRFPSALESLDQADKLGGATLWRSILRGEVLWESGRQEEGQALLRRLIEEALASENFDRAREPLDSLAKCIEASGGDWQSEYERILAVYESKGEVGRSSTRWLLYAWLQRLAAAQQWEQGRQVLSRHPWTGSPLASNTQTLQEYPAWADLLPPKSKPPAADPTSLLNMVDELRLERPELGQLMTLRSTNLKHLQSQLGPNDTLVTYCLQNNQLFLLALRQKSEFYRQFPLDSQELANLQKTYLKELSSDPRGPAEARLQQVLLEPILSQEPGQRLFLVPTGDLWQLPFGALRDAQGVSAALQADLVLLSSGDLLRMADKSWRPYSLSQPLAIGAPPEADLPGAYRELEVVANLLPDCQLRRGEQATLEVLEEPGKQWGLLHLASHAHYRKDRPTESDIELHGGKLQVKQLSRLSLADHSLVALSCCEGGSAKGQQLDEPVTLATSFSAAGAETVIANLWPVDDEVARVFFTAFYQQLSSGSPPLKSFRQAQQTCRQSFPKTRDWAGFFLLGNPT